MFPIRVQPRQRLLKEHANAEIAGVAILYCF